MEKTLISLKKQGINDLALLGGAKLINSFIKEDLITDIKITIIPQIIGGRYTWIPPEQTNEIFNLKRLWEIKSIKNLMNNEIHIHYKKFEIDSIINEPKIHKVEVKLSIKEISKEIWNELANEINNPFMNGLGLKTLKYQKVSQEKLVGNLYILLLIKMKKY